MRKQYSSAIADDTRWDYPNILTAVSEFFLGGGLKTADLEAQIRETSDIFDSIYTLCKKSEQIC